MHYTITTSGLHCGHCEARVEAALLELEGVTSVDADHETQTVEVEAAGTLDEALVSQAIQGAGDGFGVVAISAGACA